MCPTCRQKTVKKLHELPKNRYIIQFLEFQKTPLVKKVDGLPCVVTEQTNEPSTVSSTNINAWSQDDYLKTYFNEIDVQKRGFVSMQAVCEAFREGSLNPNFDSKRVECIFNKFDSDKDGKLNLDEFINVFAEMSLNFELEKKGEHFPSN